MANYLEPVPIADFSALLGDSMLSPDIVTAITNLVGNQGGSVQINELTAVPTSQEIRGSDVVFFTLAPNPDGAPVQVDLSKISAANVKTLHTLIFNGDIPTVLALPKTFDGVVVTGAGNDIVRTTGNKAVTIDTGVGNDTVTTGSGNDSIILSGGSDSITSGAGADNITVKDTLAASDKIFINGGAGKNEVDLSALHIAHVINTDHGFKAKHEITLDNGAKINITNIDTIIYDSNGDGVAETVGVKDFLADFT